MRVKILHGCIGACAYNVQVVLVPGWHMYSINQSGLIRPSLPPLSTAVRSSAMYTSIKCTPVLKPIILVVRVRREETEEGPSRDHEGEGSGASRETETTMGNTVAVVVVQWECHPV